MSAADPFDLMTIYALAQPNRLLTVLDQDSHADKLVRKQFRASFGGYFDNRPDRLPVLGVTCPFCLAELMTLEHTLVYDDSLDPGFALTAGMTVVDDSFDFNSIDRLDPCADLDLPEFRGALEYCRCCRYWRFHYAKTDTFPRGCGLTLAYTSIASKRRVYESELPEGVPGELAAWLRRTPRGWHTMSPRRFERLVADVFRMNYNGAEVTHVGRPDDGGVDVLLVESDGRQWLIQAKRRQASNASEGVSTIRNLLGAMVLEGTGHGVVVSTADHFTYRAAEAVGRARERGMVLRLLDRKAFDRMLDPLLPERPWLSPLFNRFPVFARHFASIIESERQLLLFD
jgi:hypothetical protein